jgi:hypothetical protein
VSGIRIEGNTSGNVAEVDNNNDLFVNTPTVVNNAGYITPVFEIDNGSITGETTRRQPLISRDLRQSIGMDTGIFDYVFNAVAQDTGVWKYAASTMTASQSGGYLLLNANNTATVNTGVYIQSFRSFDLCGNSGLRFKAVCSLTASTQTNQVVEFGLFFGTITTVPADGVYFRITTAGLIGVINYSGTETVTGVLVSTPQINNAQSYWIEITIGGVEFWLDGVLLGVIVVPNGDPIPFAEGSLPICFQQRNSGAVSGSQMQFKVGRCHIGYLDVQLAMPFAHQQCAMGLTLQQGIAGQTMGSSASYTNSEAAGAGTALSNTAANITGLGGQAAVQPQLAVPTDGIVCSYQNPQGTTAIEPHVLMITGVKVMTLVSTTLIGGPLWYVYSLAFGHYAATATLATAEGTSFTTNPTTKAPRRVVLGTETIPSGAAAGTVGSSQGIYQAFNSPIPVNPGEYVAVVAKNLGAVASGVVNFFITYDGFWV